MTTEEMNKEIKMTEAHKKFIMEELCPFILREEGRGFDMGMWLEQFFREFGDEYDDTYKNRSLSELIQLPKCNTVCCIGGSIEALRKEEYIALDMQMDDSIEMDSFSIAGTLIGLNLDRANVLFSDEILWPEPFRTRFHVANTPLAKAVVAVDLLAEVARTDGACLDVE